MKKSKISAVLFSLLYITFVSFSSQAAKYTHQEKSSSVKNVDRAWTVPVDKNAKQGFSYTFKEKIIYSPKRNLYVVGLHCYRGKPIRFHIPHEKFTFYIDKKEYKPLQDRGGSVWHRFHNGAWSNIFLIWIDSAYSVVALEQDSCAEVVLNTKYDVKEMLTKANDKNVLVTVYDSFDKKVGEFTLTIKQ